MGNGHAAILTKVAISLIIVVELISKTTNYFNFLKFTFLHKVKSMAFETSIRLHVILLRPHVIILPFQLLGLRHMHTSLSESPDYGTLSQSQLIEIIVRLEANQATRLATSPDVGHAPTPPAPLTLPYFQAYVEHGPDLTWVGQRNPTCLLWASHTCSHLLGVTPDQLLKELRQWRTLVHPEDITLLETAWLESGQSGSSETEFRFIRPDGALRWLRLRTFSPDSATPVAGSSLIFGVAEDVTTRREQEALRLTQLQLQRRDMIREVHHRIKNNLQGVAGLLRQHAEQFPELESIIDQAITRVRAIAVIHGLQGQTLDTKVVLCELIPSIAQTVESLLAPRVKLSVQAEIDERICVTDQEAVPLALVLNELIMNSAKHADHTGNGTPIQITLKWENQSQQAKISIVNPGSLPNDFDIWQPKGTGLTLVRSLLSPHGSSLAYASANNSVAAHLYLRAPCIHLDKSILQNKEN